MLTRTQQSAPFVWHKAKAHSLHKKVDHNALVYDTQRSVFTVDPVGAAFYSHIWKRMELPRVQDWELAYLPHRRREYGNLIHNVFRYVLRKGG